MPYLICYSDTFQIVRFFRRDKTQILLQKFKMKISDRQGSILCRVLLNTTVSAEGYSATTPTLESVGQPVNEELLWVLHAKKIRYCNGKFITIIHIGILCRVLHGTIVSVGGCSVTTLTLEGVSVPVNREQLLALHVKRIRYPTNKLGG